MEKSWISEINEQELISWRRELHQHPELSFHEQKTAAFVEEKLKSFSHIDVLHPSDTSVLGVLKGKENYIASCGYGCIAYAGGKRIALCIEDRSSAYLRT